MESWVPKDNLGLVGDLGIASRKYEELEKNREDLHFKSKG
jgi:hypothetical protein